MGDRVGKGSLLTRSFQADEHIIYTSFELGYF